MDKVTIINEPKQFPFYQVKSRSVLYIDQAIIPEIFYSATINRQKQQLEQLISQHPQLAKKVYSFYILNLNQTYVYTKEGKTSGTSKVPWKLNNGLQLYLSSNEQVNFYLYVTRMPWNSSNFGYLYNTIRTFLSQVAYKRNMIYQLGFKVYQLGLKYPHQNQYLQSLRKYVN
jgi:hypothetical protein